MTALTKWLIGVAIVALLSGGAYGYISHQAVTQEREAVALKQFKANAELQTKYDKLSASYQVLKAKKEAVRTVTITREDKLIDENHSYYAADCFNADSLQHIQSSQTSTDRE